MIEVEKINYKEFKLSRSKDKSADFQSEGRQLRSLLSKVKEPVQYYKELCLEIKMINHAIMAALEQTFSEAIRVELEKIIQETDVQKGQQALADKIAQLLTSHMKKIAFEQQSSKLNSTFGTPSKGGCKQSQKIFKCLKDSQLSPLTPRSMTRQSMECHKQQSDSELSTHRTVTKDEVATSILCQICEKVYPPNEFVRHTNRCKYELQFQQDPSIKNTNNSSCLKVNYEKMMMNLIKIRTQIEQQIKLVSFSNQQASYTLLKKKLETDLKKVTRVIKEKSEQISKIKRVAKANVRHK